LDVMYGMASPVAVATFRKWRRDCFVDWVILRASLSGDVLFVKEKPQSNYILFRLSIFCRVERKAIQGPAEKRYDSNG
jgi:hypothetical protein